MRFRISFFLALCLPLGAFAQSTAEAEVAAVITQLFDGMRTADTASIKAVFHPEMRLNSTGYDAAGEPTFQSGSLGNWLATVARVPAGQLDERLFGTHIRIDGPLATAWTPYSFYFNGARSHCGVNAFQLVQTQAGWRILQITDTRRQTGCDELEQPATAAQLDTLIDSWHQAAATADEDTFFGLMADDGIYIGTDATEHWLADSMAVWAQPYFERETAWAFTPYNRHIFLSDDGQYAWWDELLETWMGPCRGSGVLRRDAEGNWRIAHYHLSVTVPNDDINTFLRAMGLPTRE